MEAYQDLYIREEKNPMKKKSTAQILLRFLLPLILFLCSASASTLKVLFIGNSYTYVNDVPKLVESLAAADGNTVVHEQHTEGGWTLEKHWNSDITLQKIRKGEKNG